MSSTNRVESILVLDVGRVFTKADLFDIVDGQRRFLGRGRALTSLAAHGPNVTEGAIAALRNLESIVGRPVVGSNGLVMPERDDGTGVDDCFLITSVNSVLRVLVVAASTSKANEVVADAAGISAARVVATVPLSAQSKPVESRMARIIAALHDDRPDVLVVATEGTTQNEVVELAQCLAVTAHSRRGEVSIVVIGTEEHAAPLRQILPESTRLWVMPDKVSVAAATPLQERLQALWHEHWLATVSGAADLRAYGFGLPFAAREGFAHALQFVSAHEKVDVWGVAVGGQASWAVSVVDGLRDLASIELGTGRSSVAMLDAVNSVAQWRAAPAVADAISVADSIFRKTLLPQAVPDTLDELAQEFALCTEVAASAISALSSRSSKHSQSPALLIATGAPFSVEAHLARGAMLMLNAFQPVGLVGLAMDRLGILPGLGAVARRHPEAAAELVLREGLQQLGWCIGLGGSPKQEGAVAASFDLVTGGEKIRKRVAFGNLERLPLPEGTASHLTVKPAGNVDAGHGPGRKSAHDLEGGRLGLIVDARGRPLDLTRAEEQKRQKRLAEWQQALEG